MGDYVCMCVSLFISSLILLLTENEMLHATEVQPMRKTTAVVLRSGSSSANSTREHDVAMLNESIANLTSRVLSLENAFNSSSTFNVSSFASRMQNVEWWMLNHEQACSQDYSNSSSGSDALPLEQSLSTQGLSTRLESLENSFRKHTADFQKLKHPVTAAEIREVVGRVSSLEKRNSKRSWVPRNVFRTTTLNLNQSLTNINDTLMVTASDCRLLKESAIKRPEFDLYKKAVASNFSLLTTSMAGVLVRLEHLETNSSSRDVSEISQSLSAHVNEYIAWKQSVNRSLSSLSTTTSTWENERQKYVLSSTLIDVENNIREEQKSLKNEIIHLSDRKCDCDQLSGVNFNALFVSQSTFSDFQVDTENLHQHFETRLSTLETENCTSSSLNLFSNVTSTFTKVQQRFDIIWKAINSSKGWKTWVNDSLRTIQQQSNQTTSDIKGSVHCLNETVSENSFELARVNATLKSQGNFVILLEKTLSNLTQSWNDTTDTVLSLEGKVGLYGPICEGVNSKLKAINDTLSAVVKLFERLNFTLTNGSFVHRSNSTNVPMVAAAGFHPGTGGISQEWLVLVIICLTLSSLSVLIAFILWYFRGRRILRKLSEEKLDRDIDSAAVSNRKAEIAESIGQLDELVKRKVADYANNFFEEFERFFLANLEREKNFEKALSATIVGMRDYTREVNVPNEDGLSIVNENYVDPADTGGVEGAGAVLADEETVSPSQETFRRAAQVLGSSQQRKTVYGETVAPIPSRKSKNIFRKFFK